MLVVGTLPLGLETMRKVIIAALALTPMLLHAQANSPAKTQPQAQVLQSKLVKPDAAADTVTTAPSRISTGVVAPKLVSTVGIVATTNSLWNVIPVERNVVVSLIVDKNGKPEDVKIEKSAGATLDASVIEAVSKYRFKPGTLDNEPTAVPVNLEITVQPAR